VDTHRNEQERDQNRASALAVIEREYPCWRTWAGVAGLLYARRPRSSPPMVVRSVSLAGLRAEIELAERKRGLR
jgi:hypothetical protein